MTTSIQQHYLPDLRCFGCGPANASGLQLASFTGDDGAVRATFSPWPEHDNGLGFLNGGIVSTLLDCHSAAAVCVESERLGLPPDGTLQYVTAGLDVRFRRPSPLTEPAELVARVLESSPEAIRVEAELWWQDKVRATGEALWKRWHPR